MAQTKSTKHTSDQLKNKIPIGTSSARLHRDEINIILKDYLGLASPRTVGDDMNMNARNTSRMKWEDLESESDEEGGDMNTNILDNQEEYIVTVTLFSSSSFVNLMQSRSDGDEKVLIPADSLLLEVVKDSYQVGSDLNGLNENLGSGRDKVDVVMSKLLIWPASALVDISNDEHHVDDRVEPIPLSDGHGHGADGHDDDNDGNEDKEKIDAERAAEKDLESQLLAKSNGEESMNMWKNIRKALHLPKSVEEMDDHEKQSYYNKKLELRKKHASRRVGVTSTTLFRKTPGSDRQVDMDEIMDVLGRMTLGTGVDIDPDLLATRIEQDKESVDGHDVDTQDLLLSCLCNDGKVHVFSILDLLRLQIDDDDKELERINLVHVMTRKDSSEDSFLRSFESLLLGDSLKASMDNTILPLSKPIATVYLSVIAIKGKPVVREDREEDTSVEEKQINQQLLKIRHLGEEFGKGFDEYGPHVDLSQFDANIEPSTMHDRTMNNVPFISAAAFEYIVVGGRGMRKSSRVHEGNGDEMVHKGHRLEGGFVTFISTRYFNETRTMFLPFVPKNITPIIWKSMKLVVILGEDTHHCVAIRTDSSSYVSSASKPRRSTEATDAMDRATPKHQIEFIKKFTPIKIAFEGLEEDMVSSTFPVSITCMPAHPTNILLCTILNGDFHLQNFHLDSLQFGRMHSKRSPDLLASNVFITAQREPHKFVEISPPVHSGILLSNLTSDKSTRRCKESFRCVSGQGWALFSLQILSRMHVFYLSWDGSTEDEGAYYEEIAVLENPNHESASNITNLKYLEVVEGRDEIECGGRQQVAVASLRLGVTDEMNITVTMRSKVVLDGITSSYEEILSWLCDQNDYYTAAIIALSLLDDKVALADVENSMSSHLTTHDIINHDGILESITSIGLHDTDKTTNQIHTKSGGISSVMSYREKLKLKVLTDLSNMAVNCLVNGGSTLAHALDNFLGRNDFYDANSACQILVENATRTIRNFSANDMKHLAPYSYNPMQSEGHALWPIQCLLRVAVTRNYTVAALTMLNENIPDELRHRSSQSHRSDESGYASSFKLSKSIISMILASSGEAGSVLMGLVETGTEKMYWDSLDGETQLSLSMLHVQGRYPLLREIEVREWALKRLHAGTGLIANDTDDIVKYVPSEWLRELCTGVLSNAGCNLSQTILFTPALSINPGETLNAGNKDLFQERQEEEEDLHDYLTAAPGFGGVDFDLIIPSFLILEKRNINWLGNENISSQMILNAICDLAGRHSSEEPKFSFDSIPAMKQCVIMENALAAANLIGGENGLVLKCAFYVAKEGKLSMNEAERILRREAINTADISCQDNRSEVDLHFMLTEGHKSILWLLEKYTLRVRKYGEFYSKSRGQIDPVFAARICFRVWLYFSKTYPGSGQWLEDWLKERLDLNINDTTSKRLPHAAIIRALLWTDGLSEAEGLELESKPVLAMSLGLSTPFLVNLARIPCGLLECVPPHTL